MVHTGSEFVHFLRSVGVVRIYPQLIVSLFNPIDSMFDFMKRSASIALQRIQRARSDVVFYGDIWASPKLHGEGFIWAL
jgi:hypothetical protein